MIFLLDLVVTLNAQQQMTLRRHDGTEFLFNAYFCCLYSLKYIHSCFTRLYLWSLECSPTRMLPEEQIQNTHGTQQTKSINSEEINIRHDSWFTRLSIMGSRMLRSDLSSRLLVAVPFVIITLWESTSWLISQCLLFSFYCNFIMWWVNLGSC